MNQIQIVNKFSSKSENLIIQTVQTTLEKLDIDKKIVEIEQIGKEGITKLNFEYRSKNEPTDVLSFPLNQVPAEKNLLGNIFICEEVAKEREEDVLELVKHGILHLVGFDHELDQENWKKEAKKINHNL